MITTFRENHMKDTVGSTKEKMWWVGMEPTEKRSGNANMESLPSSCQLNAQ